ncbi:hypothetical protein EDF61_104140 [Arthrobacter sp. JUb115]|nr:hypothetical protein EDF61_104140 [Arthrobacter sp. JUb115]
MNSLNRNPKLNLIPGSEQWRLRVTLALDRRRTQVT